jgi:hypothetical protein
LLNIKVVGPIKISRGTLSFIKISENKPAYVPPVAGLRRASKSIENYGDKTLSII